MQNSYFPKYDLASRIQHTKFDTGFNNRNLVRMESVEAPETQNLKQVFSGVGEDGNT